MSPTPAALLGRVHTSTERFAALDGWRGISILLVLASHLLPLGPKNWQLNAAAGPLGMTLFFCLSGFLITNFLLHHSSVVDFMIRRLARILPLAWLGLAIALPMTNAVLDTYLANFLFYANLPPFWLEHATSHYWSLCVEMQFYAGIAAIFTLFRTRGLLVLPALCLAITALRIVEVQPMSIVTWYRVDEILAGCTLALAINGRLGTRLVQFIARTNPYLVLALLFVSAHPDSGFFNYLRPYASAWLVGVTLLRPETRLVGLLKHRWLAYVAHISYALYVIHPLLAASWLGQGDTVMVRYAKRPLLFAATFLLAHLSTFYYEDRCIQFGKRLSRRLLAHAQPRDKRLSEGQASSR